MRKYVLCALLAAAAAPAAAQEAVPFSGVRVEGVVGYDAADVEGENSDGVTYGAQASRPAPRSWKRCPSIRSSTADPGLFSRLSRTWSWPPPGRSGQ